MKPTKISIIFQNKELIFEIGQIARQANGSVFLRCGETAVLATACSSAEPLPEIDFLPLRVDYQEKFSSVGKTLSGFIKREGKPTERETLVSRLIDRPVRPMIQEGYHHDVQLLSYVYSYDNVNTPDVLAICASSAALCLSDIPLIKPIAAVRVGRIKEKFIVNPSPEEMKQSELDLVLAGTDEAILMIEGSCQFLSEETVLEAIEWGHESIKIICQGLLQLQQAHGKTKRTNTVHTPPKELLTLAEEKILPALQKASTTQEKQLRDEIITAGKKEAVVAINATGNSTQYSALDIKIALETATSKFMRKFILDTGIRWDGRSTTDIRSIFIEQGILPRAHGSSLFTRGETQALAVCVLGGEQMGQRFEDLHGDGLSRFYLQYFFPPFSVGEVGRMGAPGRREVGHGKLAERALSHALPEKELFPYTIRLESNITESNGSSSMASVCGGTLAMMNAGIPLKQPIAGIAMGLIVEKDRFAILSDILGIEDSLGDMDFKVAGSANGITAFQMDIKVEGIPIAIIAKALTQAKNGRLSILNTMEESCPQSSKDLSKYAPVIEKIKIKPSKIGIIIGPGGKQIRAITEQTDTEINISDDGWITLSSSSLDGLKKAKDIILELTAEAEIGQVYKGKIVSIVQFGIFVEIFPGKEGLCHISELDNMRIDNINDYMKKENLSVGDSMEVVVLEINDRGQLKLSKKAVKK
ncbi:MAG: polyribonucleotide nucleotidyltransferase [Chlamydia sp.]